MRTGLLERKEKCRQLINDYGIWRKNPHFNGIMAKSGDYRYTWQFYLRRVLYNSFFSNSIGEMFWFDFGEKFRQQPFQIGACEAAGVPMGCAIQNVAYNLGIDVNLFTIKQEAKKYGLRNFTEGPIIKDLPVVLVDDLAGSQNTLLKSHKLLVQHRIPIHEFYCCIVDKAGDKVRPHLVYLPNKLKAIYTADDFDLSWEDYVSNNGKEPEFGYFI